MQKEYTVKDSSGILIKSIVWPYILAILETFIFAMFGTSAGKISTNTIGYLVLLLLSQSLFFFMVFIYNKRQKIDFKSATKIGNKINLKQILIIIATTISLLFLFLPFVNLIDYLIRLTGYSVSGDLPFQINNGWYYVLALFFLAVVPAICEELVFRGVIFNGLRKSFSPKFAIIMSALSFTLMHASFQQTVYPFILGIVFAIYVYKTDSLRSSMLGHFINNATVVTVQFISTMIAINSGTIADATEAYSLTFSGTLFAILFAALGVGIIFLSVKLFDKINKDKKRNELSNPEIIIETPNESNNVASSKIETKDDNQFIPEEIKQKIVSSYKNMFYIYLGISFILWLVNNISSY